MDELPKGKTPTEITRSQLLPYLFEAGLDPDRLSVDHKVVINDLMIYQVIDRRQQELDDIAEGKS